MCRLPPLKVLEQHSGTYNISDIITNVTTLLFIHGFASAPKIWEPQIKEFSGNYIVETTIEKAEKSRDLVIIGWSIGGLSAIDIYLKNRDNVKGLVLVSAFPKFFKSADYQYGISPALLRNLEKKIKSDFESGINYFYKLMFPDGKIHPLIGKLPVPDRTEVFSQLDVLKTADIRGQLSKINIPVLLIHGDRDQICPIGSAEYMRSYIPGAKLGIFKGAGHAPFLEDPVKFNSLLNDFILRVIDESYPRTD